MCLITYTYLGESMEQAKRTYTTIFYSKQNGEEPAKEHLLSLNYKMRAKMILRKLQKLNITASTICQGREANDYIK